MLYFATPSGPRVLDEIRAGRLGFITSPRARNTVEAGMVWCCDNDAFSGGYVGDDRFLSWLTTRPAGTCRFVTAPDVVGDAAATLARSVPMLPRIRSLGYPVALVAQNGIEDLAVPWSEFDALFIGGDTAWKLGPAARAVVVEARRRGRWVHMGRVNSWRRLRYAHQIGCDSVDGTYLAFGPDQNLPKLLAWLAEVNSQGLLWTHDSEGVADAVR